MTLRLPTQSRRLYMTLMAAANGSSRWQSIAADGSSRWQRQMTLRLVSPSRRSFALMAASDGKSWQKMAPTRTTTTTTRTTSIAIANRLPQIRSSSSSSASATSSANKTAALSNKEGGCVICHLQRERLSNSFQEELSPFEGENVSWNAKSGETESGGWSLVSGDDRVGKKENFDIFVPTDKIESISCKSKEEQEREEEEQREAEEFFQDIFEDSDPAAPATNPTAPQKKPVGQGSAPLNSGPNSTRNNAEVSDANKTKSNANDGRDQIREQERKIIDHPHEKMGVGLWGNAFYRDGGGRGGGGRGDGGGGGKGSEGEGGGEWIGRILWFLFGLIAGAGISSVSGFKSKSGSDDGEDCEDNSTAKTSQRNDRNKKKISAKDDKDWCRLTSESKITPQAKSMEKVKEEKARKDRRKEKMDGDRDVFLCDVSDKKKEKREKKVDPTAKCGRD